MRLTPDFLGYVDFEVVFDGSVDLEYEGICRSWIHM